MSKRFECRQSDGSHYVEWTPVDCLHLPLILLRAPAGCYNALPPSRRQWSESFVPEFFQRSESRRMLVRFVKVLSLLAIAAVFPNRARADEKIDFTRDIR